MRRDLVLGAATGVVMLGTLPAYGRVFADLDWRGPAMLSALLALALAVGARRLRLPVVVAGLVSLVGFVLSAYVLHLPAGPLVPGTEQLGQLRDLLAQGVQEVRETPAPAPSLPGLVALVSTGYWLVTVVVHEVAVRLRRPGLALLPATALWTVPLAVPVADARSWTTAVPYLAAAALLLLLSAEDGLELAADRLPRLTGAGVTLGAVAIVVGITAPGLLPGYDAEAWVDLRGGGDPRGYQPIVDVSERLKLPEDRDVLRVHSEQRTYLRLAGLDSFDGYTWRLGPSGEGSYQPDPSSLHSARDVLPPEEPAPQSEPVFVDVEVLELENIYVPAPYQPVQVLGPQRDEMVWSTEGGFLATWDTVEDELEGRPRVGIRQGVQYRVQAARPAPTFEDLAEVAIDETTRARWTQLPRDYPELRSQAEEVYAAAGAASPIEQALALQDWFVGDEAGFTYDLDVPALRGEDALTRFVLEERVGYCEYYATAMAVMLRATGIPARVAVGFLPGRVSAEPDPAAGRELTEFTVSTRDAHAWVEVLFPGHGWVTFEPTPRDDRSQMVPRAEDLTPVRNERERAADEREAAGQQPEASDAPEPSPSPPASIPEAETPAPTSPTGGDDEPARWPLVVLAVAVLGMAGLLVAGHRRRTWRVDGPPGRRVLVAQRHLLESAAGVGVGRRTAETTPELVARWQQEGRVDARGDRFAAVAQRAAFGGELDERIAAEAEQLVDELESMLLASVDRRDRALAPLRTPALSLFDRGRRVLGDLRARRGR